MSEDTENSEKQEHISVLFDEVMEYLAPKPGGYYLDGTLGLGGHAQGILDATDGEAHVLGLDRDEQALAKAAQRLGSYGDNVHFANSVYSQFDQVLDELGWKELDGALLDLGVSSFQLDTAERGFSFIADGPLDMRMSGRGPEAPASRLVNKAGVEELKMIIGKYGEEPMGGRIARAIIDARARKPIETTLELAQVVEQAYPAGRRARARNHPATKTFQALRMAVNRELDELKDFLERVVGYLKPGARVAIISFHSLEDRIVKHFFRTEAKGCLCPKHVMQCACGHVPTLRVLTKKPITATEEEIARNNRARSAKFRVAEKLPAQELAGEG